MNTSVVQNPPFWPSRQLWFKLFLAGLCAVSFNVGFSLVFLSIQSGIAFMGGHRTTIMEYLLGGAGVGLVLGCPVAFGIFLAHSLKKGVGSGLLSLVALGVGGALVGQLYGTWITSDAMLPLPLALITGVQITVLELTTGDIRSKPGIVGLGVGLAIGTILTTVLARLVDPYGQRLLEVFSIPWLAYSILVWLTTVFFVELFTRRVSWGGVMVWTGLVGLLFSIGFLSG